MLDCTCQLCTVEHYPHFSRGIFVEQITFDIHVCHNNIYTKYIFRNFCCAWIIIYNGVNQNTFVGRNIYITKIQHHVVALNQYTLFLRVDVSACNCDIRNFFLPAVYTVSQCKIGTTLCGTVIKCHIGISCNNGCHAGHIKVTVIEVIVASRIGVCTVTALGTNNITVICLQVYIAFGRLCGQSCPSITDDF